jgi:hypothetical protein
MQGNGGRQKEGRPRRRCEDNITKDFRGIGCSDIEWTGLVWNRD